VRDREIERDESLRGQSLRVRDRPMMGLCVGCGCSKMGKKMGEGSRDQERDESLRGAVDRDWE
jgi:hypothetical protein